MELSTLRVLAEQTEQEVREAGEVVRSIRRPEVSAKEGHANFVTSADLASAAARRRAPPATRSPCRRCSWAAR